MYNTILITIDSLRPDFLGCYNGQSIDKSISKNIDRLAMQGIIFNNAYSQGPHTPSSFPALLSGNYSTRFQDNYCLSDNRILISEILKSNGFQTYAFNSNPFISRASNYHRGFDSYEDNLFVPFIKKDEFTKKRSNLKLRVVERMNVLKYFFREPYSPAKEVNKFAQLKITDHYKTNSPFFLWLHYMDVHGPYIRKKGNFLFNKMKASIIWKKAIKNPHKITKAEQDILIDSYKEEMMHLDFFIGELLQMIDMENTIIVLTADHGELFGEHGLYGHPLELYDNSIKVPLIINLPSKINIINKYIGHIVCLIDVVPTILDINNIKMYHNLDGQSLFPLIINENEDFTLNHAISEIDRKRVAITTQSWKYIINEYNKQYWLYDRDNDPFETDNVIHKHPDVTASLHESINKHLLNFSDEDEILKPNFDDDIKKRLKALGYFDY